MAFRPLSTLERYSPALASSPTPPEPVDLGGLSPEERELCVQVLAAQHMVMIGAEETLNSLKQIVHHLTAVPSEEMPQFVEALEKIQNMMNQKGPLPYDEALSSSLSDTVHALLTRYKTS